MTCYLYDSQRASSWLVLKHTIFTIMSEHLPPMVLGRWAGLCSVHSSKVGASGDNVGCANKLVGHLLKKSTLFMWCLCFTLLYLWSSGPPDTFDKTFENVDVLTPMLCCAAGQVWPVRVCDQVHQVCWQHIWKHSCLTPTLCCCSRTGSIHFSLWFSSPSLLPLFVDVTCENIAVLTPMLCFCAARQVWPIWVCDQVHQVCEAADGPWRAGSDARPALLPLLAGSLLHHRSHPGCQAQRVGQYEYYMRISWLLCGQWDDGNTKITWEFLGCYVSSGTLILPTFFRLGHQAQRAALILGDDFLAGMWAMGRWSCQPFTSAGFCFPTHHAPLACQA